jgi:L-fuconolactonase
MVVRNESEQKSVIVDAHHHLWRYVFEEYSWMGTNEDILRRDFTITEYLAVAQQSSVSAAIAVQSRQMIEDTDFLVDLAKSSGISHFVVGWFDLLADDAEEVIAKYAQLKHVVGARHFLSLESDNSLFRSSFFRERLQLLAAHDLTFDLLVRPDQLQYCADLVGELPELTFVLDHLGNPVIGGDNSNWRTGLKELSTMPNVYAKVSGLTHNTLGNSFDVSSFDSSLECAVEFFGTDRLIFGSNWPVVDINASFGFWMQAVSEFFNKVAPDALPDILGHNAIKAYNLKIGD